MDTDSLNDLLANSAPATSTQVTSRDAQKLISVTRRDSRRTSPRRAKLAVGAGVVLVALFSGGTVAAFANPDLREWFQSGVQDPYVSFEYTVPSGAVCTETYGDPLASDPAAAEALRTWLDSAELEELVDTDAALKQLRSYEEYDKTQIGSDDEYQMAVGIAIVLAARKELSNQGFPNGSIDQWKSEGECSEPAP